MKLSALFTALGGGARHTEDADALSGRHIRRLTVDDWQVALDRSTQVLTVQIPFDSGFRELERENTLSATPQIHPETSLVSASVLAQKAKIFDDGLYAAVELAAQHGAGHHPAKARLIAGACRLAASLCPGGRLAAITLGAARLGDVPAADVPGQTTLNGERELAVFLADELRSKPLGFYTWSEELSAIFRQDRMLQTELDRPDWPELAAFGAAMAAEPELQSAFDAHQRLFAGLTNPLNETPLTTRFFPPSVSHETQLIKRMFGLTPIPAGFVLINEMIRRIRDGRLDLAPNEQSGWYDWQTWALEPLVIPARMPEAARLNLHEDYRSHLLKLFKGLMTLSRETHTKQLECMLCGSALYLQPPKRRITVAPDLSIEPVPTYYLRRHLGYRFVRKVLEGAFGEQALSAMHRITADGTCETSLAEELGAMEALFAGAHATSCAEIGLDDQLDGEIDSVSASDAFGRWAHDLNADPDLGRDVRCMVPVFHDLGRGKTKVWVFMGWDSNPLLVTYGRHPVHTVRDHRGRPVRDPPDVDWGWQSGAVATPVSAEIYVDRLLDRDEFRRLCDRMKTQSAILHALGVDEEAMAGPPWKPDAPGYRREDFRPSRDN